MATPAAILNLAVIANTKSANMALAGTQARLRATAATSTKTGLTMKKAMLGAGLAAAGVGVALFKVGEEFDNAFDKIQSRTGATGKDMVKLKRVFRDVVSDVPASFEEASDAVGELSTRLDLSGKPLAKMSKQITELSRITGTDVKDNVESVSKAFQDWDVAVKKQSSTLDAFFRLSQKSGLAVADITSLIQKFGSPLRQLGFDIDEAAAMFANFEKAGVNIQTMVPGLKLAISNLTRPTAILAESMKDLGIKAGDPEKALKQVFALMSSKTISDVERTGLAMDVFGKRAGADMAEAIRQGRFELDDFLKVMKDGDGTIREQGRRTMDLAENWQVFANNLKLMVEPTAKKVFKGLGDLMGDVTRAFKKEGLQGVIDLLLNKLNEATPKIIEAGSKIAGALVKGIITAPFWAKVAVGALLFAKFGGVKAASTAIGAKFGKGFVLGLAVALPLLVPEAFKIGQKIGHAIKDGLGGDLADIIAGTTKDTLGRQQVRDLFLADQLEGGAEQAATSLKSMGYNAKQAAQIVNHWLGKMGDDQKEAGVGFEHLGKVTQTSSEKVGHAVGDAGKKVGQFSHGANSDLGKTSQVTDQFRAKAGGNFDGVGSKSKQMQTAVSASIGSMGKAVAQGFQRIGDATNKALAAFGVKPVAFAIGQGFDAAGGGGGGGGGHQRGGIIRAAMGTLVTGTGEGDRQPALLEAGEVVLNKKAVAAIGGANRANSINKMIPRFAGGGKVDKASAVGNLRAPFDVMGSGEGFVPMMNFLNATTGGGKLVVISGIRPGATVAGTGTTSNHSAGNAVDISTPSIRYLSGLTDQLSQANPLEVKIMDATNKYLADNFAPPVGLDQLWRTAAGGGHWNHIHKGINPKYGQNAETMMDYIGGLPGGTGVASMGIGKAPQIKGPDGPLKALGQAAINKVHGAARKFVAKKAGTAQAVAGGGFPGAAGAPMKSLPSALAKYNKTFPGAVYPSAAWSSLYQMPADAIAALAEWAGGGRVPGVTMEKVQRGEGAGRPGSRSTDGGWGLWAITSPFNDAAVAPYGGYPGMLNPVNNAKVMAQIFDPSTAFGPIWHGWEAAAGDTNHHYTGPLLAKAGGIVQKLAGGGRARGGYGASIPGKPQPGSYRPSTGTGTYTETTPAPWLSFLPDRFAKPLGKLIEQFPGIEEKWNYATTVDAFNSSPAGSELSPEERASELAIAHAGLWNLMLQDGVIKNALPHVKDKKARNKLKSTLAALEGSQGSILTWQQNVDSLADTAVADTTSADQSALIALLEAQHTDDTAKYALSAKVAGSFSSFFGQTPPFGGAFHQGGVVPGPRGQERMVLAQGGEVITPEGGGAVYIVVEDGAVDASRIRAISGAEYAKRMRDASRRTMSNSPPIARKL